MVDRITPVTTDDDRAALAERFGVEDGWPVVCEPFTQWVLEDRFSDGRPPFEEVGVQLVPDVEPYELMKLRLLNASHQALCYLGYLAGYRYAHEVCQDPLFADFLLGYMDRGGDADAARRCPGSTSTRYKHQLIERFANPEVRDTLARLCAESSDRIPKWLVPVIRAATSSAGGEIDAAPRWSSPRWARYAEGVDEQGEPIEVVDRLQGRGDGRGPRAQARRPAGVPRATATCSATWSTTSGSPTAYVAALDSLHEHGARATLEAWEQRS